MFPQDIEKLTRNFHAREAAVATGGVLEPPQASCTEDTTEDSEGTDSGHLRTVADAREPTAATGRSQLR